MLAAMEGAINASEMAMASQTDRLRWSLTWSVFVSVVAMYQYSP